MFSQNFSDSIINLIWDYHDYTNYWKNRFSNDVLVKINKNIRYCGLICNNHAFEINPCECDISEFYGCANCYSYGICFSDDHHIYGYVSLEEIKQHHSTYIKCPYIPDNTFVLLYQYNREDKGYINSFKEIQDDLNFNLPLKRIEFIKKSKYYTNIDIDDEEDEMLSLHLNNKSSKYWYRI